MQYGAADQLHGERLMMISQALQMRTLIVLLDGVDEAAGRRDALMRFVRDVLIVDGFRVVVTSRPGGHLSDELTSLCVVLRLEALTDEQQREAADRQLSQFPEGIAFSRHLSAFTAIRKVRPESWRTLIQKKPTP